MKNVILIVGGAFVLSGLLFWAGTSLGLSSGEVGTDDIVATRGIHWHPTLFIYVDGEKIQIPANVGLMGGHYPVHTHSEDVADGVLHFEFSSIVRTEDLKLKNFFAIWDQKEVATAFGTLDRMMVNGEENGELGEYAVQSEDSIELFYTTEGAQSTEGNS